MADLRSLAKRLLASILLVNCLIGLYLYVDLEQLPSASFLSLTQMGRFEDSPAIPFQSTKPWLDYIRSGEFNSNHQGLINDPNYCQLVREFREENPVRVGKDGLPIRKDRVVYSDYKPGNLVKDVILGFGVLTMPEHYIEKPPYVLFTQEYKELEPLDPAILIFHQKTPGWHLYHKINSHFLCPNQRYNHIPGHEHFVNKDEMAKLNRNYGEHYSDRKHCFDPWTFMPETLDLATTEECFEFFDRLAKDDNLGKIKWIKKKARGSHNAEGVEVVTEEVVKRLQTRYDFGATCSYIHDQYIAQHYIENPLLVNNKKFDFRVYMLIASVDPLLILYHDGFLRVSLLDYDSSSNDTMAHVTNTQLAKDMLDQKNASEKEYEETMSKQMWTFPTFEQYMISEGLVAPGWLDSFVRRTMKEKMLHLTRMVYEQLLRHPGVYELFGVDFMFDSDLNLWFLEVNRSPAMQATTEEKGRIQSKMTKDIFDIEFALLTGTDLDPVVSQTNFNWIFDGRQTGMDRYQGLLTADCL